MAWHKANPPVDRPPNLIDDALAAVQAGRVLSELDLAPIALGPYIAGLDTSANTIAFMLYDPRERTPALQERSRAGRETD